MSTSTSSQNSQFSVPVQPDVSKAEVGLVADVVELAPGEGAPQEYLDLMNELSDEDSVPEFMLELDYEEVPILLVDTDGDRALMRQKEMMEVCFGGIGEESKEEKRMGLAMQQLDIEQRHALRLLLIYQDPVELATHLKRCLEDPVYGYGERGDNGRTIAQAMAAIAEEGALAPVAATWLEMNRDFQQRVLASAPLSFRSLFDYADLTTFVPLLQRVGDMTWRLGIEGEGKHRDFGGSIAEVWSQICDTYVQWSDEDNEAWLSEFKRKAAKLPDSILRTARADRLRKEQDRVQVQGAKVTLTTERNGVDWPRMIVMKDEQGNNMLGLSRLSGHSFYELAWNGALNVRRFEISGTTRNKIPFEHVELATMIAEALGTETGLTPDPVEAGEVEAAYLRRMKATGAEIGPAQFKEVPQAVQGKPAASYKVCDIIVTMLRGGEDFAYITVGGSQSAFLMRRDDKKGVMAVWPVVRNRPRVGGAPLMSTPLAELDLTARSWNRALCAWGAWLAWVLK
ncbi:MAG: hypothetical protein BroJett011_19540 [Chloroflexota bacterium]|nr:MAG: hypothetical protein BroJett011_19540 [Chloroflexota bacterium]